MFGPVTSDHLKLALFFMLVHRFCAVLFEDLTDKRDDSPPNSSK